MKLHRKTFIAGGAHTPYIGKFHPDFIWKGHPDFGKRENPSIEDYISRVTKAVFDVTGIEPGRIDKGYVANFTGECFVNQGHLGAALAGADPALKGKPMMRVEGACASGGLALTAGIDAIQAGYDVVLVVGVEVQNTVNAKIGADYLARAAHYKTQRSLDPFTFPCLFARRAKEMYTKEGVTEEDVAKLAVKAYDNANRNEYAHMHTVKMTLENAMRSPLFLENEEYHDYLRVSGCSQVSDGASALVLLSEKGAKDVGRRLEDMIQVRGYAHATGSLYELEDLLDLTTTRKAATQLYAETALTPSDVDVLEVHDCFAVTEILMYEALGFAERGKGVELVRNEETTHKGRLPTNAGGGLLAFGHPVGATGVKQAIEMWRMMTGRADNYELAHTPKLGLTANMGGDDRTAVVAAYQPA